MYWSINLLLSGGGGGDGRGFRWDSAHHTSQPAKFATLLGLEYLQLLEFLWPFPVPSSPKTRYTVPEISESGSSRKTYSNALPFAGLRFPPWRPKLNSYRSPQSQPAAARRNLAPQRPEPQPGQTRSLEARGRWALTTRRDAGLQGPPPYSAPQIPKSSTRLWLQARNGLGES